MKKSRWCSLSECAMAAILTLGILPCPAWPQVPPRDLAELSLDELMSLEVTTAGKVEQSVFETASAVYVISEEEIRRSGATTVAELLRMVPGVHVARVSSNRWAVSVRGFNGGQSGNKLLVMVDGRSVYSNLFALTYWDVLDPAIEDIERIEVIRGPGAVLWGSNAVNGVVNIITKPVAKTLGGLLTAGAGNLERAFGDVRYGARINDTAEYRVYGKYFQRDNFFGNFGVNASDAWHLERGGFRLDWRPSSRDTLQLQGSILAGLRGDAAPVFDEDSPGFTRRLELPTMQRGGFSILEWRREATASHFTVRLQFERSKYQEPRFGERRDNFNTELEHHLTIRRRHSLVWGLAYNYSGDRIRSSPTLVFDPESRAFHLARGYVQDDIEVIPERLHLILGTKIEDSNYTSTELSPNARMTLAITPGQMVWGAISHADRRPSRVERDLKASLPPPEGFPFPAVTGIFGNRDIESEELNAFEAGYRAKLARRVFFEVTGFHNRYTEILGYTPGVPFFESRTAPARLVVPLTFANHIDAASYGGEIEGAWTVANRWTLKSSYSYLSVQTHGNDSQILADPRHQFQVRSMLELPRRWELDMAAYFVDELRGQPVAGYTRLDTRIAWRSGESVSLELAGQNLLDKSHPEFNAAFSYAVEVPRSIHGKIVWRF